MSAGPAPDVAVCTLTDRALPSRLRHLPRVDVAAPMVTANVGIEELVVGLLRRPRTRHLVVCGTDSPVFRQGQSLLALAANGCEPDGTIVGALGYRARLGTIPSAAVEAFRERVQLHDLVGVCDPCLVAEAVAGLPGTDAPPAAIDPGPDVRSLPLTTLTAGGPRKPFTDDEGYFVVDVDRTTRRIEVRHYACDLDAGHRMTGGTAQQILLGLVRHGLLADAAHAGYLGAELAKAEAAIRLDLPYRQDMPLGRRESRAGLRGSAVRSAAAVDIGGTKLAVRAEAGDVCWTRRITWAGDGAGELADVLAEARDHVGGDVERVAIACPPTLDADGRVVAWPNRPAWVGVPLRALVTAATGASEVVLADDGSLAALGESRAADCPDLVYLGVGTGVGGGIVSGGRLLTGSTGAGAEIGHLVVDPGGPLCRCGRHGCLQAICSGPALQRRAAELSGHPVGAEQLVRAVADGRSWALRLRDEAADALAVAVTMLDELIQPARVHIGGGLGTALASLPGCVAERLTASARPGRPAPAVAPALAGADASLAGALLVARGDVATLDGRL